MRTTQPRIRSLADLPAPPSGRMGWPWTDVPDLPVAAEGDASWPRITIVTPSLDQADFLEATLRSVLLQGYPNLEYIVVDGGSTDGSVEILEKYDGWIDNWTSEPDEGQSDAINKGFRRATGDILAWLNSDDSYYQGTLFDVADQFSHGSCDLLFGCMDKIQLGPDGESLVKTSSPREGTPFAPFPILRRSDISPFSFFQPGMFWTADLWRATGPLNERCHYVMDREWCLRALARGARVCTSDQVYARFLLHPASKSEALHERFQQERIRVYRELGRRPEFRRIACWLSTLRSRQTLLSLRAEALAAEGHRIRALLTANLARGLKLLRVLPGLRGAPQLRAEPTVRNRNNG